MGDSKRATLRDVARRAGVSNTTASYILNGRSSQMRIAADTQDRVREAADALNYRPNPSARNLRARTTRSVGVISDYVAGGPFASQMLTGASEAARMLDHVLVIGESGGDRQLEALLIEELLDRRVDGIVYATLVTAEVDVPTGLAGQRAVLLNCVAPGSSLPAVLPDELQGGKAAVGELDDVIRDGEVWVVGEDPTPGALAGRLRLEGIESALAERGHVLAGVVSCLWDVRAAYDAVAGFLARGARPAALICLNDRIGMGAYQALSTHGLRVPDDISLVSFDGSDLARWLQPELSSVVLPFADLGARAVELLLSPRWARSGVVRVPMLVNHGGSVRQRADSRSGSGGTVSSALL